MTVEYLDAKRVQGSSTALDYRYLNYDSGSGANNRVTHDLTSIDSDEWTLRFRLRTTAYTGTIGGAGQIIYAGVSSTPSSTDPVSGSNNAIGFKFGFDTDNGIIESNGGTLFGGDTEFSPQASNAVDLDRYVEIKRTSSSSATVTFYSDEYSTSTNTATDSSLASLTDLRYITVSNYSGADAGTLSCYITDMNFYDEWNGSGTAPTPTFTATFEASEWSMQDSDKIGVAEATTDEKATLVTSFPDSLGSSADGTLIGDPAQDTTPTPPTGLGTSSFYFDGNDAIDIDGAEPFSTTVGSISLWFYNDGTSNDKAVLFFGDTDASSYLGIETKTDGIWAKFRQASGTTTQWEIRSSNNGITLTDAWHHLVISQDGTAVKVYVDTVLLTTFDGEADKSKWMESNLDNGRIGCNSISGNGNANFLTGNIMEIGLWNVALTSTQVESLYGNGGSTAKKANTEPTGLRAYYPLSGTTVTNDLADYSNLPENTIFNETDTYKQYWLQDGVWRPRSPTYETDFSSGTGWTTSDSSKLNVASGALQIYTTAGSYPLNSIYKDLTGSAITGDFVIRYSATYTTMGGQSLGIQWHGLTDGGEGADDYQDALLIMIYDDNNNFNSCALENEKSEAASNQGALSPQINPTTTTYYIELIHDGSDFTTNVYSNSGFSTLLGTRTIDDNGASGLRYFTVQTYTSGADVGYINDLKFWEGVTEP